MQLSVIIPALNEAEYLCETIRAVREHATLGEPHEVIVADCGSTDGTADLALKVGARLVQSEHGAIGRGFALNNGASYATGDVLLFLDADTLPPAGYDEAIRAALEDPDVVGGAFEFALDGGEFGLRIVELINRIRYRLSQCYYGDQGIFVRAGIFRELGGYPPLRILEASHFCAAMKRVGELALIHKEMKTSPRRFLEGGVYRVLANDIWVWWLNLTGRNPEKYADAYWMENKGRGNSRGSKF